MTTAGVGFISALIECSPLQAADQIFDGKKVLFIIFSTFAAGEFYVKSCPSFQLISKCLIITVADSLPILIP